VPAGTRQPQRPELGLDGGDRAVHLLALRHVGLDGEGAAPGRGDLGGRAAELSR
jgi:hypothetical protein